MEADDSLEPQIARLDVVLYKIIARPAVRAALNRIEHEKLMGLQSLDELTQLCHASDLAALLHQANTECNEDEDALLHVVQWGVGGVRE
jgi:hypothetical protein